MIRGIWRTERDGGLSAEVADYRLIVEAAYETNGMVRFQVMSRDTGSGLSSGTVLGAGFEKDVRTAMQSAERMADRAFGRLLRL
jgi:hypothetical protein